MLLDVLGLVSDHADERVELDDCHTQVDQIDRVRQQTTQGRNKVCGGTGRKHSGLKTLSVQKN